MMRRYEKDGTVRTVTGIQYFTVQYVHIIFSYYFFATRQKEASKLFRVRVRTSSPHASLQRQMTISAKIQDIYSKYADDTPSEN
jgi:hypothetical protein